MITNRTTEHPILPLILHRWSPRAMSGEPIQEEELLPLFEAARWAPSSYNGQPWRFIVARKDTPSWETFLNLLIEFNRSWADKAAALVVICSHQNFEFNNKPSITHQFDTGAAWENLALEASHRGLVAHGMEGFDYDKSREVLGIPEDYTILAMYAVGKPGKKEDLSKQ